MNIFCYAALSHPLIMDALLSRTPKYEPASMDDMEIKLIGKNWVPGASYNEGSILKGNIFYDISDMETKILNQMHEGYFEFRSHMSIQRESDNGWVDIGMWILPERHKEIIMGEQWAQGRFEGGFLEPLREACKEFRRQYSIEGKREPLIFDFKRR